MRTIYKIQDTTFTTELDATLTGFDVKSSPRNYKVEFVGGNNFKWLAEDISKQKHPLILVDKNVKQKLLSHLNLDQYPCFEVEAVEQSKNINKVLEICDFLLKSKANRGSMLYVIGGGILQDLGAFAGAMFKRGIPWTLVPTTLLSQADSCLGGKTAVNHGSSKNVLGLFSAPRRVCIDSNFITTLTDDDRLSGAGEIFRLLVTGGVNGLQYLRQNVPYMLSNTAWAIRDLTIGSLCVKQAIVEHDEFEIDIRRSMNYGHSIGHALEALTNYAIPHGTGVAIGILVENQIAVNRGMLSAEQAEEIFEIGRSIIPDYAWAHFANADASALLPYLSNDKKAEGANLKLATLQSLGDMKFVDLPLDESGIAEVKIAIEQVIAHG